MNSDSSPVGAHADVLVLGFGKGGKTAAAQLGHLGKRVVLVEQSERMYGGTCPNVGCIPSKGMVHHSGLRRPEDPPQEFYARAVDEIQAVREFMRVGNRDAMDAMETVELITGRPVFVDPHTVRVEMDGEVRTITADTILINTGSEPRMPDIAGLRESPRTMTSTDLLERRGLPERLVIIGAGPIGIEFAQIYRHFGSEVTLIAARAQILPEQDDDVAATAHATRPAGPWWPTSRTARGTPWWPT
jgi:pyruvate/2-oxoglutarate dehydrogenase complex dihydrolipoamide dehydrogenase (E3) component